MTGLQALLSALERINIYAVQVDLPVGMQNVFKRPEGMEDSGERTIYLENPDTQLDIILSFSKEEYEALTVGNKL